MHPQMRNFFEIGRERNPTLNQQLLNSASQLAQNDDYMRPSSSLSRDVSIGFGASAFYNAFAAADGNHNVDRTSNTSMRWQSSNNMMMPTTSH